MNVLALQYDITWENKPANFEKVGRLLRQAQPPKDSIAALPEMFATGFTMEARMAEAYGSETEQFVSTLARELGIWIIAGAAMQLKGGRPYVPVMVNGQGPFTFILDTGTNGDVSVTQRLVEQLSLPRSGLKIDDDGSGVNRRLVPAFHVDSVSVAGVEFKDLRADQCPGFHNEFDGILGFTLFRDYLLTLDYPNRKVILARGSLPPADGKEILPLTLLDKLPVIELSVGSRKVGAMLDSGGTGLILPARFAERLKFATKPVVFAREETVSTMVDIKGAPLASDIHFGAYTLKKPFLAISTLFPIGNFGGMLLKNFAVTFDQNNKLVRFVCKDKEILLLKPRLRVRVAP